MSQTKGISNLANKKKRNNSKHPCNVASTYTLALLENGASVPKIFVDGEVYQSDLIPAPNQTQVHFYLTPDGSPRCLRYRMNVIEDNSLLALQHLLPSYSYLTDLRFEHCSLNYEQMQFIHTILQENRQIVHLSLNGNPKKNPTDQEGLHLAVQGTWLKMYQCQLCNVTPIVAKLFYYALYKSNKFSSNLVSLNLGCNKLGDDGCMLIASALRSNRFLQALNLSDNVISAKALIDLLIGFSKFPLTPPEIHFKREAKITKLLMQEEFPGYKLKNPSKVSVMSSKTATSTISDLDVIAKHPFLVDTFEENGKILCSGNNTLLHLNISYNEITANVLEAIIQTIGYQNKNFKTGGFQRILVESRYQFPDLIQEMNDLLSLNMGQRTKRPNSNS